MDKYLEIKLTGTLSDHSGDIVDNDSNKEVKNWPSLFSRST